MIVVIGLFACMLALFELAMWLERIEKRRTSARRAMASRPASTRAGRVP